MPWQLSTLLKASAQLSCKECGGCHSLTVVGHHEHGPLWRNRFPPEVHHLSTVQLVMEIQMSKALPESCTAKSAFKPSMWGTRALTGKHFCFDEGENPEKTQREKKIHVPLRKIPASPSLPEITPQTSLTEWPFSLKLKYILIFTVPWPQPSAPVTFL